jgi:dipeptidyl aminopeptidase/acylaminoacyl peptidase
MRVLLLLCLILSFLHARAQQPVTNDNIWELPQVGSPTLSPDGKAMLFTVARTDLEKNEAVRQLIYLDLESLRQSELTYDATDPQWSPDGKYITYLSDYGGSYGLYKAGISIRNKKASLEPPLRLTEIEQSNHFLGHPTRKNYAWSPDGRHIAFVAADPASCDEREDPDDPLVVERTLFKSRTAFSDNCLTRIYVMEASGQNKRVLTTGPYDSHSLSWAPDSRRLCFLSNHSEDPDQNYNNELWTVDIETGEITRLTTTAGTEHEPHWSPGGDWIAFPATVRPLNTKDSPPENTFLYALSPDGEKRVNLTLTLDRRASNPQWHPGGEWLYFSIRDEGKYCIYRVRIGEPPEAVICEEAAAGNFHVGADKIAFTYQAPGQPAEIYTAHLDGSIKQRVTFETRDWAGDKQFAKVEDFWFASFDGVRVQGFLAYPPDAGPGDKLPVIHRIHGGPHGMYGYTFSDFNELLVSRGYAVVYINPRGSTGYGQKFADGTYQAWGGGDYKDLMYGIDAALEQFEFLDGENMGVTGGSYGGFMTNWVITQTDRYKAAATVASVSNLISFYGTSLYQLLIETEFGGMPWDNYHLLWHFSPLAHVQNVQTPTLLLHGENDMDVPITQAEEFYIALKKLGVPARFVRYPNEGHGIRQPQHRRHYYNEIIDWFGKYVPPKP